MIDSFVLLTPILMLPIVALLAFVGCNWFYGLDPTYPLSPGPGPTGLQATAGNGKVVLEWDDYPGAIGFKVKRGETSGFYPTTETIDPMTTYTDSGLTNGTTYFYVITAETAQIESEASGEASATPTAAALVAFLKPDVLGSLIGTVTGWFGMVIDVGGSDVVVETLGRMVAPGNSQIHVIKIVDGTGADVPGAFVSVNMAGGAINEFRYMPLVPPVTLNNTKTYFIVSQEIAGVDAFYNHDTTVKTSDAAAVTSAARGGPPYVADSVPQQSYGLVNFQY